MNLINGKKLENKMKNKIIKNSIFCNKKNYGFGVDFSDSHLRLLQIKYKKDSFDIIGWSQRKIPKGIVEQGKIIKKEDFIEILKDALENSNGSFVGGSVMVSIPEEKVFTRVIQVPLSKNTKELEETIKWETESNIPVSINDIYYDWQIIKENQNKIDVLVMATNKDIIDNYLEVFDSVGLEVVAVEPESLSIARSLIPKSHKEYTLLIDMGNNFSNFVICKSGLPIFTSSSSISGNKITELIVREFGFGFEKAERYKIKRGLEDNIAGKKEIYF